MQTDYFVQTLVKCTHCSYFYYYKIGSKCIIFTSHISCMICMVHDICYICMICMLHGIIHFTHFMYVVYASKLYTIIVRFNKYDMHLNLYCNEILQ